jgi:hypothetical protein
MRIGEHPSRHKAIDSESSSHRVIIPIYIPNSEGYFEDAFNVLKVCVSSLLKTINDDTKITLISNASSNEVNDYIYELQDDNKIDRAIFNKENVGKMNALMTETRASFEEFITYSDADVFFDKGWLKQTYTMFKNVPKAGFVSMNPTPNNYGTANSTLLSNWISLYLGKNTVSNVCSYTDLEHFHKSIGRDSSYTDTMYNNNKIHCLNKQVKWIVGAGHFCCTIRKTPLLNFVPVEKSTSQVSGGSETRYLDVPFDKTGLWKLSSPKAYVWHMGNVLEKEWAENKIEEIKKFEEDSFTFFDIPFRGIVWKSSLIPYKIKLKLVSLLSKIKII